MPIYYSLTIFTHFMSCWSKMLNMLYKIIAYKKSQSEGLLTLAPSAANTRITKYIRLVLFPVS